MPSTITHTYIGLDTLEKLNSEPKSIINSHINNYKIYCQNMDIFYFYRIFLLFNNKVQTLGHQVHKENTLKLFKLLINDNKINKDPELFTFISGLITHYKADSLTHPYVNYMSLYGAKNTKFKDHFAIETFVDSYIVRERMNINHKKDNNSKEIFNFTEKKIIKEEIDKIFKELYNYPNMGKKYYRSLREMRFVFNHCRYDKYGAKMLFYKVIDLNPFKNIQRTKYLSYHFDLENEDFLLNTNHNTWFNVDDNRITSNKSYLDLYNDAVNESSSIINELYEHIYNNKSVDLDKIIGNYSYSNGLQLPKQGD